MDFFKRRTSDLSTNNVYKLLLSLTVEFDF